ncbi:MAG: hypothetical protein M1834_000816 [Cirrosporium novae-zelandiae]|nr:MAG: hypothetical protein M1834_000816 [Cirrosporium novae-zelandiae]
MAAGNNLVDVSLFEDSPTDDSRFALPEMRGNLGPNIVISSWEDIPEEFRPLPLAISLAKPLPPLPPGAHRRHYYHLLRDVRTDARPHRCILTRFRCCSWNDNLHPQQNTRAESYDSRMRSRPLSTPFPQFQRPEDHHVNRSSHLSWVNEPTTTTPPSYSQFTWEPSTTCSELVWLPDQQIWLRSIEMVPVQRRPRRQSVTSPTLENERLALFQQATATVSFDDHHHQLRSPPPSYYSAFHWDMVDLPSDHPRRPSAESQWSLVGATLTRPVSTPPVVPYSPIHSPIR